MDVRLGLVMLIVFYPILVYYGLLPVALVVAFGESMTPTLDPPVIAVGVATWIEEPGLGDFVLYRSCGVLVAHRVVGVDDGKFMIKGDCAWCVESIVNADDVVYVVLVYVSGTTSIGVLVLLLVFVLLLRFGVRAPSIRKRVWSS